MEYSSCLCISRYLPDRRLKLFCWVVEYKLLPFPFFVVVVVRMQTEPCWAFSLSIRFVLLDFETIAQTISCGSVDENLMSIFHWVWDMGKSVHWREPLSTFSWFLGLSYFQVGLTTCKTNILYLSGHDYFWVHKHHAYHDLLHNRVLLTSFVYN